jgi:hypothetical protein
MRAIEEKTEYPQKFIGGYRLPAIYGFYGYRYFHCRFG